MHWQNYHPTQIVFRRLQFSKIRRCMVSPETRHISHFGLTVYQGSKRISYVLDERYVRYEEEPHLPWCLELNSHENWPRIPLKIFNHEQLHLVAAVINGIFSYFKTNDMFGVRANLTFLDVSNSVAMKLGKNPSLFNYEQLLLAAHVIIDFLRAQFVPSDVVFMAPYIQQLSMMGRALQDLSKLQVFSMPRLDRFSLNPFNNLKQRTYNNCWWCNMFSRALWASNRWYVGESSKVCRIVARTHRRHIQVSDFWNEDRVMAPAVARSIRSCTHEFRCQRPARWINWTRNGLRKSIEKLPFSHDIRELTRHINRLSKVCIPILTFSALEGDWAYCEHQTAPSTSKFNKLSHQPP